MFALPARKEGLLYPETVWENVKNLKYIIFYNPPKNKNAPEHPRKITRTHLNLSICGILPMPIQNTKSVYKKKNLKKIEVLFCSVTRVLVD